ncbi:uncharacterized protein PRCAT00003325001 [Priceomyces carsonii]|uniref:uncharacterized protein n=1 Tax=Priceomyces carsonii TaxID=28549 RepID=UPI002ED8EE17|nr:unnamed protein product [Priceomyces carsonii]
MPYNNSSNRNNNSSLYNSRYNGSRSSNHSRYDNGGGGNRNHSDWDNSSYHNRRNEHDFYGGYWQKKYDNRYGNYQYQRDSGNQYSYPPRNDGYRSSNNSVGSSRYAYDDKGSERYDDYSKRREREKERESNISEPASSKKFGAPSVEKVTEGRHSESRGGFVPKMRNDSEKSEPESIPMQHIGKENSEERIHVHKEAGDLNEDGNERFTKEKNKEMEGIEKRRGTADEDEKIVKSPKQDFNEGDTEKGKIKEYNYKEEDEVNGEHQRNIDNKEDRDTKPGIRNEATTQDANDNSNIDLASNLTNNKLDSSNDRRSSSNEPNDTWSGNEKEELENLSEAETDIADSPPRIKRGKKLVRKKSRDHVSKTIDSMSDGSAEPENLPSLDQRKITRKPYRLKRDSSGRSLLQRACEKGNLKEIRSYIERGADVNEHDFCGFTCLHEAALQGHTDVVRLLIKYGANVNAQADEAGDLETPLIDASENKHLETVKLLLENGANPNIFNLDGLTALTKIYNVHGDEEGYEKIVEVLESAKMSYSSIKSEQDSYAITKCDEVLTHKKIVEDPNDSYFNDLLKKKGIFKFAAEGSKELTANYFVSGNSLDSKPDILFLAARNGHAELVDIILGLNPNSFDIDNENACGVTALLASVGRGHLQVVESLLLKGADPLKFRRQDHLNALEIAQCSVHFDPEEIRLIKRYIEKRNSKSVGHEDNKIKVRDFSPNDTSKTKEYPEQMKQNIEALSSTEPHPIIENENASSSPSKRVSDDHDLKGRGAKKFKPEKLSQVPIDEQASTSTLPSLSDRQQVTSPDNSKSRNSNLISPSPSSVLNQKIAEELKTKNVEDARVWQEKVEAKKKARIDMFLKLEKEKEKKRKEEEKKKIEEDRKLELVKEEEKRRLAAEAREKEKELNEKKKILQYDMILHEYPIGLKYAKFGESLTPNEIVHYAPLYLFDLNESTYVVDLQVALLTGSFISSFASKISRSNKVELNSDQKSKIWGLFFPFIGIGPSDNLAALLKDGYSKFQNLSLHFIKFDEISHLVMQDYPLAFKEIWDNKKMVSVDLECLQTPEIEISKEADNATEANVNAKLLEERWFLPPYLRNRKDSLKTIYSASSPLW